MLNLTVLAATYIEGRRFLAAAGLRGAVVHDAASAQGRRFDVVLELPSFTGCRARFAVEALIRAQGYRAEVVRMLIDEADMPDRVVGGARPSIHQTTVDEQITLAERDPFVPVVETPTYTPRSRSKAARTQKRAR